MTEKNAIITVGYKKNNRGHESKRLVVVCGDKEYPITRLAKGDKFYWFLIREIEALNDVDE